MTHRADRIWERWVEVDRLFEAALERPAAERERFLDRECASDTELLDLVRSLLDQTAEADTALAGPGPLLLNSLWPAQGSDAQEPGLAAGERIGRYRITGELGRGGMATVYAAERADGAFQQQVAIKVLRRGLDTDDVIQRFLTERQILSGLEHPNIARLLDGGATADGRPFLVMERVAGQRITDWADANRLTVRDRLELVLQVADAVQFAHRNLVVHRDLKPSNILVDDDGRVRLLDFGIARLLSPVDGGDASLTREGMRPHTPEYASPEQVRGESVTTASDVYQLGLLLYVLLTGRRPFPGRGVALETAITGGHVTRPSDTADSDGRRASSRPTNGAPAPLTPEAIARSRRTTPEGLARALRGDVDTIVLEALRTEPEQRYASVDALAADLRRHLSGQPVTARPDTLAYRTSRLLRRHRWIAPTAAAAALFLGVYIATLLRYASRLEGERDRAEQAAVLAEREAATAREATAFLTGLFRSADPFEALQDTITVVGMLERGARRIRSELGDQPLVRAELLRSLGNAFSGLGRFEVADSLLHEAHALFATELEAEDDQTLETLRDLAGNHSAGRDFAAADTAYRRLLAVHMARTTTPDTMIAGLLSVLGSIHRDLGHGDSAVALASRGVAMRRAAGDTGSTGYLQALAHLAPALRAAEAFDSAEVVYRDLLRRQTGMYGMDDIRLATTHNNLGFLLRTRGDYAAAESSYREALRINRAALGDGHPQTVMGRGNLAAALELLGKLDEVEALTREQIAAVEAQWPNGHWRVGTRYNVLGRFFARHGRFSEAVAPLRTGADIYARTLGPEHDWALTARLWQGLAVLLAGNVRAADELMAPAYERLRSRRGSFNPDTRFTLNQLADVLEANGHAARAAPYRRLLDPT